MLVRVAVIGDVRGSFAHAAGLVRRAAERFGAAPDVVLCTGDVEANRHAHDAAGVATSVGHRRWVGEFPRVLSGRIVVPAPLWFVGGDHEPWAALDAAGPGPVAANVSFLGRAGVASIAGLEVAFLSGVRGDASSLGLCDRSGRDERACYVAAELLALRQTLARRGRVDVLVTHEAPAGVFGDEAGNRDVRALVEFARPHLHLSGHGRCRSSALCGDTLVERLGPVSDGPAGGLALFVRHADGVWESMPAGRRR